MRESDQLALSGSWGATCSEQKWTAVTILKGQETHRAHTKLLLQPNTQGQNLEKYELTGTEEKQI